MNTSPENNLEKIPPNDLQEHYEFDYEKAKPNRFAPHLNQDTVMVVLDPDVAALFPTSEAVNETLRVFAAALKNLQSSSSTQPLPEELMEPLAVSKNASRQRPTANSA